MLEMTIGTLERENVARQNQTDSFDMRNLERNLFEKNLVEFHFRWLKIYHWQNKDEPRNSDHDSVILNHLKRNEF